MADDISRHNDRIEIEVEKENTENLEHVTEQQNGLPHIDPARRAAAEKSLKRKLDARCSLFVLIYIMNYLDRNNISAARLKGLQEDLGLTDTQYSTCLSILYVGYILMQVPSNMFINRISRPSIYIAISMTLWGLISTCSGNAKNFGHMVAIRFLLGFVEAAFLPGALLILSKWYTRKELTTRNAILFCGNLISNAFSSLIAAGVLSNMEGVLGHAAWRWLFWIEGAITMTIAVSAGFILPDLPTNARGFTEDERLVAQIRILEDVGEADTDSEEQSPFTGLIMALKDYKIYIMMLSFTAYVVGLSFNAFFPTLTGTLGFSEIPTLLLSAPPMGLLLYLLRHQRLARRSNPGKGQSHPLYQHHSESPTNSSQIWHIYGPIVMGLVGFIISMSTLNVAARYVALFLQAGSYAGFIVFYSWISSSFPRPPAKRAVALALINAFSQLGNVAGSYVWDLSENGYRKSYGIVTAMFGITIVGFWLFRMILVNLNNKLAEAEESTDESQAGDFIVSANESLCMRKGFRYLV
ncbi:hypothetical protein N7532_010032 [Penicillium argentinense]|uniref:Major facilitator superfamily (MFS) profile domain-containing protein n=1 Tax=Penicillium argentinense TaxID=1131581 RepID=A0A9W9JXR2_9EURO|nr:uncharacterized protein N7532_010032 [Penicillium argentinense]KAJ5085261.1 hypothetical protein N7532_010032 [Penicillium argentinense]